MCERMLLLVDPHLSILTSCFSFRVPSLSCLSACCLLRAWLPRPSSPLISLDQQKTMLTSPAHSRFARGLAWLRRLLRYLLLFLCSCMDGSTCFTERQRLSLRQQECMRTLFFVASALPHIFSSPLAL